MECEISTIQIKDEEIEKIFQTVKTIAIVGLSSNPKKDSHKVAKYLKEVGFNIIPIYPKEDEILGFKVYRSLEDIPEKIDMVNMFRRGSFALNVFESITKRDDIKSLWLQKGIVNNEVGELCKKEGLYFIQDRCIMIEHKRLKGGLHDRNK